MADPNDAAEYAQMAEMARELAEPDKDLPLIHGNDEVFPEYGGGQRPEPQPRQRAEPQPQPRHQQDEPRPQPQQRDGPPDVDEDPVGHFQWRSALNEHRTDRTEQQLISRDFLQSVEKSENQLRNDLEDPTEYDDACDYLRAHRVQEIAYEYPDTQRTLAIARQHGIASPAQLRHAMLQNDIMEVAANALRQGVPPAQAYYNHATARGFKRRSDALKSEMRNVIRNTENIGSVAGMNSPQGKAFDAWFDAYARMAKDREAVSED